MLGVSIIVCCYNSALRLPKTIQHIALQQVQDDILWEVIIIDNASIDNTASVAKAEWEKHNNINIKFRVIKQPIPGLSHARDKGIEIANYEYLLFCDDDNWLLNDYVSQLFNIMQADTRIGALGGCGIFEPEQPVNHQVEKLARYYVNGPQNHVEKEHWVYGAGAIYRKSLLTKLKQLGWQQITTDRIGKVLLSGGDVEICLMLHLMGYKIKADNNLKFKHFVAHKKQNTNYIINLSYWLSYSSVLLNSYYVFFNQNKRTINDINNSWLRSAAKTFIKDIILIAFQKFVKWQAITVEQKISLNSMYGTCASLLKNRKMIARQHQQVKNILVHLGRITS
ncbi:glycosyltransferase family 2 protein [Mucilaginibacter sp.]